jgi:hypothetical protein
MIIPLMYYIDNYTGLPGILFWFCRWLSRLFVYAVKREVATAEKLRTKFVMLNREQKILFMKLVQL